MTLLVPIVVLSSWVGLIEFRGYLIAQPGPAYEKVDTGYVVALLALVAQPLLCWAVSLGAARRVRSRAIVIGIVSSALLLPVSVLLFME